jgi:hypothetical protein
MYQKARKGNREVNGDFMRNFAERFWMSNQQQYAGKEPDQHLLSVTNPRTISSSLRNLIQ